MEFLRLTPKSKRYILYVPANEDRKAVTKLKGRPTAIYTDNRGRLVGRHWLVNEDDKRRLQSGTINNNLQLQRV